MQIELIFSHHALERMFERAISKDEVRAVVDSGETIIRYPDDAPYLSRMVLGWGGKRNLHVILADIPDSAKSVVITVYKPDQRLWEKDLKSRKP